MEASEDKTRVTMILAVVLWISAFGLLFLAIRLRMKPIFLVALLDGMLALFVTMLAIRGGRR